MNILSNPSKTVIFKSNDGWYERDCPTVFHPSRRAARDARAARIGRRKRSSGTIVFNTTNTHAGTSSIKVKSTLEQRAERRMFLLGVSADDIAKIVPFYGYNASVSYAHMRAASATHDEAESVIQYADPDVSRLYGVNRASGLNHGDALRVAFDG